MYMYTRISLYGFPFVPIKHVQIRTNEHTNDGLVLYVEMYSFDFMFPMLKGEFKCACGL